MKLEDLRKKIDELDEQLLDILNQRMEVVKEVGTLKNASNSNIYRPEREQEIIDRLNKMGKGSLNRAAIEAIYLEIFAISRNLERSEKIAFLGPEGTFTHQAAESRFGSMSELLPIGSIRAIFETVDTGRAKYGVVPIENNQEGIVSETIDLLGQYDLNIVAEIPMSIHIAFATNEDDIKNIKKIYSKDIALRQCRGFLNSTFPNNAAELIPVSSTSQAATLASTEKGTAAVCPHIAAKLNNLPIMFDNIEDSVDNHTRFLIIGKDMLNQKSKKDKTSVLVKLSDETGSLAKFLMDFHDAGINLNKIESRPAKKGKGFDYLFFIDLEGHYQDNNVKIVMKKHEKDIKLLGSYVKLC